MNALHLALPLAALLLAGPALAQPADHDAHHPPSAAAQAAPAAPMSEADMHARCQAMMGARMAGPPAHDHARDKMGMVGNMKTKPPTEAEMDRMHAQCAAMMAKAPAAPEKK